MSRSMVFTALAASVCFAAATFAQAPASAPTGSTGMCKDGTYYSGATKKGTCRGHEGVKDRYAAAQAQSAAQRPFRGRWTAAAAVPMTQPTCAACHDR